MLSRPAPRRDDVELDPTEMRAIVNRAKRAHGHLGKVVSMMEDGADCEDVLTQLAAVLKALERTGFAIVATGLQQCIAAGDGPESVDVKKMERLFLGLA
jgi:DNA-binding FrmR family transcriptional regulator